MAYQRDGGSGGKRGGSKFGGPKKSFGGGKSFGGSTGSPRFGGKSFGKKSFGGGFGDRGVPEMHSAVCAECGDKCQVPFKPNGRKPVLCSNCFVKDGGSDRSERSFAPKRYEDGPKRFGGDRESGSGDAMQEINRKLDIIIRMLND